jgi:hypothetical protein
VRPSDERRKDDKNIIHPVFAKIGRVFRQYQVRLSEILLTAKIRYCIIPFIEGFKKSRGVRA